MFFILLLMLLVCVVFIRGVMHLGTADIESSMKKVILNFVQLQSLATGFPLKWPTFVLDMFSWMGVTSSASAELLSLSCVLSDNGGSGMPVVYQKAIIIELLPLAAIAFAAGFWYCNLKLCRRRLNAIKHTEVPHHIVKGHESHRTKHAESVQLKEEMERLERLVHGSHAQAIRLSPLRMKDCGYIMRWAIENAHKKNIDTAASIAHFSDEKNEMDTHAFQHMIEQWGTKLDDDTLWQVVSHIDKDNSGKISTDELRAYYRSLTDHIQLSITVILFLFYPTVCKTTFALMACRSDLEHGQSAFWLQDDLTTACFDGNHLAVVLAVGLPSALLYVLGLPLGILVALRANSKDIHTDRFRFRFGMLVSGYEDRLFWWESIIAWRKMLFILCSVVMKGYGTMLQIYLGLGLIIIFLCVQVSQKPFQSELLDEMENFSLLTSFATFYSGLAFFALDSKKYNGLHIAATAIIVLSNAGFLLFAVWEIVLQHAVRHKGCARKLLMFLQPCRKRCCKGNSHKAHRQQIFRALDEMHADHQEKRKTRMLAKMHAPTTKNASSTKVAPVASSGNVQKKGRLEHMQDAWADSNSAERLPSVEKKKLEEFHMQSSDIQY